MKTVLVTGANGFVGYHLVKELSEHDIHVISVGGTQQKAVPQAGSDYFTADLTDPEATKQIDFSAVDGVIHLAGLAALAPSFQYPLEYVQTNMGIEINLFEAALAQNVRPRFLIVSSATLYSPTADPPLTEASKVVPNSPYSVSKLGQEQLAQYYTSRGFECIVARPFNHIGPKQNLGFIVPDLTKQVVDFERGLIKEVLVGNLDAKRDYTDVRDIARAYRLLLEKGTPSETYNVCSGRPLSGHDILATILAETNANPPITEDPTRMRPSDTPVLFGDHQKLADHTGWQPEIAIETTIQDVVADWRSRSEDTQLAPTSGL